jgi:hypothetical protein
LRGDILDALEIGLEAFQNDCVTDQIVDHQGDKRTGLGATTIAISPSSTLSQVERIAEAHQAQNTRPVAPEGAALGQAPDGA